MTEQTTATTTGNGAIDYLSIVPPIIPPKAAAQPAAQGKGAQQQQPSDYLLTAGLHDEGNAQCTHERHGYRFLHNDAWGWLQYTGTHWTTEGAEAAVERAITETLQARITAANTAGAEQWGSVIAKCIPNHNRVTGAKNQLRSMVYAPVSSFDNNPDLLNCANGAVNLRTGALQPHSIDQRFMYCVTTNYKPEMLNSTHYRQWCEWLETATSKEQADWLQMAQGYSATGHTREEILVYMHGPTRSGKGTYTTTMLRLFGEPLAKAVQFSMFTAARGGDDQNFDLAPLKPSRFIAASESKQYERFNEAKVKQITGGDSVSCAFKHRDHFTYTPQFKIWLSSNHPINADPDDDAVWGRFRAIEFPNSYLGKEDKGLKLSFQSPEMLEAILVWIVTGARRWYALGSAGLPEIESSQRIKEAHRGNLDNVAAWLDEQCSAVADSFTANSMLYLSYERWCKDNGVEPKKQKSLSQALLRKGYQNKLAKIDGKMIRGFVGIAL